MSEPNGMGLKIDDAEILNGIAEQIHRIIGGIKDQQDSMITPSVRAKIQISRTIRDLQWTENDLRHEARMAETP